MWLQGAQSCPQRRVARLVYTVYRRLYGDQDHVGLPTNRIIASCLQCSRSDDISDQFGQPWLPSFDGTVTGVHLCHLGWVDIQTGYPVTNLGQAASQWQAYVTQPDNH
jgi:hypothetical protein